MARKNLIEVSAAEESAPDTSASITAVRPIAGFIAPGGRSAPIGGITKTLGSITQKFERAQDIEKQLAEGQTIVELDTGLVDGSFISDRLGIDAVELSELVDQIKNHGQQVPILVRPHPEAKGRYQVAYGHRRLAAVKKLDIKVRAVIRELSDTELVVSQGQENNARTNLSYIERALFAVRLEERSFSRETIMAAIGVDKAALSKMISVVRAMPVEVIEAIGAAPEVGRRRWMDFAEHLLRAKVKVKELLTLLSADNCTILSSNQRFQVAVDALSQKQEKLSAHTKAWTPDDDSVRVALKNNAKKAILTLEAANGPRFADWITENLEELYETFRKSIKEATGD